MAHGSPRMVFCHDCKQYIWVSRFQQDPNCPDCNKKPEQTTEYKLKEQYWVPFSYNWSFSFDLWIKLPFDKR